MVAILLTLLAAGQAAAVPPKPAAQTMQQRFDAASTAAEEGRCTAALAEFAAIEAAGAPRRNPLLAAAIDVRKGPCLIAAGRMAEGEAAMRRGVPLLATKGAEFALDVRNARIALGKAAWVRFDYDTAATEFRAALDGATGANRVMPLLLLSRVLMFDHDGKALAAAQEALTIATATPGFTREDIASVQTQHARVLMNEGRDKEAYAELKDSLSKQGGLTMRVGMADIATRSDLAIAAMRNADVDGARNYLVYTGAGRMEKAPFATAVRMDPPACGGAAGLKPTDQAIVEFSIEQDGRVGNVVPIYTSGDREVALAFARAVADWSWRTDDVKDVPALFRYTTRVEMRCVKAPERPQITAPLREAADAWLTAKAGAPPAWADLSDAAALPVQRAALARAAPGSAAALQALDALAYNPVLKPEEAASFEVQARAVAERLDPPPAVRTLLAVSDPGGEEARAYRERLRALLARPDLAADPLSAATLRLLIAGDRYRSKPPADAGAMLDAVIDMPDLPAQHPLKIAAMLQRANLLAAANDLAGARRVFDRTGLTAEQCAMIGLQPSMKRPGGDSNDYPMAAVQMGFEGWVKTEFDIAADGKTIAPRAVIAYPPFVFNDAATGIVRDSRYTSSFRPEGALACSGKQQSVIFRLP